MKILSEEEIEAQYEMEALDEARDVVANLEVRMQQIRSGTLSGEDAAIQMSQEASNLRLKVKAVNLPGLTTLSHRLDEYLAKAKSITVDHLDDLQRFSDRISAILDGDSVPAEEIATVIRSLPHKSTFDVADVVVTDTEVTLVMPQKTAARVVERELAACGYRVSTVLDPIEAFEIILDTKPDMVITTAVMQRMSGIDLACALAAMPSTREIPVAVLTSLDANHPDLKALPMTVGIIRRGPQFGTDLAETLARFSIT
ncbi:DNA-binding response regulator [Sneathiella sp. P13V-1]|uniref:response regulator n=1 Tax=Sneathiella sp. P13V-1 TaxID=2697366 RepID=UPI00187BA344|nr:DNA-binding response regulator [Sneathiella sp. P13V-1]MBE7635816.1 DNA-binding response regulator [Sneathiella sp. P13V-1]